MGKQGFAFLAICAASSMGALQAGAAQIEVPSRVEAVELHLDAAIVQRTGEFSIPSGDSTLVVRGVSPKIDAGSIRARGEGGGDVTIGAVTIKPSVLGPSQSETAKAFAALVEERQAVGDKLAAAQLKKRSIEAVVNQPSQADQSLRPSDWPAIWAAIGAELDQTDERIRAMTRRGQALDVEIEKARQAAQGDVLAAPGYDIFVETTASGSAKGKITLNYLVRNATWAPIYDARLDFNAAAPSRIAIVRRAEVAQRVGEAWDDVKLVLTTTRVASAVSAEKVLSSEAGIKAEAELPKRSSSWPVPPADSIRLDSSRLNVNRYAASSTPAKVSDFETRFDVPGLVSIPPTGVTRTYRLSSFDAQAEAFTKASPGGSDSAAYLHARFTNPDKTPLLPGIVQLYRNGAFIGRSFLNVIAAGAPGELGFGLDDAVSVRRTALLDKKFLPTGKRGMASKEKQFRTVVRNGHDFPFKIMIEDHIPVSGDASLSIIDAPGSTPPTIRNVEGQPGILAWTWDYRPGEEHTITSGFRATWPIAKGKEFYESQSR